MRYARTMQVALAGALAVLLMAGARAGEWPSDCEEGALPTQDSAYPSDQLILTCLPSNFNGTLLIYAHGYVKPQ
jgi:hypothetical protein